MMKPLLCIIFGLIYSGDYSSLCVVAGRILTRRLMQEIEWNADEGVDYWDALIEDAYN